MIWRCREHEYDLSERALIMGILNVTPDSFSDGGAFMSLDEALAHAREMEAAGAAIIDIGGESTRPGAKPVSVQVELKRTIPLIEALRDDIESRNSSMILSIDTSKALVAEAAIAAGASIVNDVTGLEGDQQMPKVCQKTGCGVVIMHKQGDPQTMQNKPEYDDVVKEVRDYFLSRYQSLVESGIDPSTLCFDPGIGFGKTDKHNFKLLKHLEQLRCHQRPLLLGVSKKSVIARTLGDSTIKLRDWPTVALTALGTSRGGNVHRVHQVRENYQAVAMTEAIRRV